MEADIYENPNSYAEGCTKRMQLEGATSWPRTCKIHGFGLCMPEMGFLSVTPTVVYIVKNNKPDIAARFDESVKVFTDYAKAKALFDKWRGQDSLAAEFSKAFLSEPKSGVKEVYMCGNIDVELLTLNIT